MAYECGGSRAMVAVSYIEIGYAVKLTGYGLDHFRVVDYPEMVAEAIGCGEVIFSFSLGDTVDDILQHLIVGKSEEIPARYWHC